MKIPTRFTNKIIDETYKAIAEEFELDEIKIIKFLIKKNLVTSGLIKKYNKEIELEIQPKQDFESKVEYPYIKFNKKNNETFGITVEFILCKINNLNIPKHMKNRIGNIEPILFSKIEKFCINNKIKIVSFFGNENKECDFYLDKNKTLSVKSNIKSYKVCPQNIGQISRKNFDKIFNINNCTGDDCRKEFIIRNIRYIFKKYMLNLFCCDFLLWIFIENNEYKIIYIKKTDIKYKNLETKLFTFTRYIREWNESSSLKYNGITVGEFQFHKNRDNIKFRFDLKALMNLLNN